MGDRVSTSLTVLREHEDTAVSLIEPEQGKPDDRWEDHITVCLTYYEVNYGTVESLVKLRQAGIPYSFAWDAGSEFTEGEEHLRFTPEGEACMSTESQLWPSGVISECITLVNQAESLEAGKAALQAKLAALTPMPWDNQAEYGRLYQARQLISPT